MKNRLHDFIKLFANRDFSKLWIAQVISLMGDYVYSINLYIWIYKLTGSTLAVSSSIFFQAVPRILMAPVSGIIIDRFNRKKILIISDLLRGLFICGFIFVKSKEQLVLVYIILILNAIISRVAMPTKAAIIPSLLPLNQLIKANSVQNLTESVILIMGPALGGLLATLNFRLVVLLNILSFLFSALLLSTMRVGQSKTANNKHVSHNLMKEWDYTKNLFINNRYFKSLTLINILSALGQGGINVLYYAFLLDVVGVNKTQFGIILAFQGVGSLIGAMFTGLYANSIRANLVIGGGILTSAISVFLYCTFSNIYIVILTVLLEGIGISGVFILIPSLIQANFAKENLGKVFGVIDGLESVALFVSMGVSGIVSSIWGIKTVLYVLGVFFLIAGITGILMLQEQKEETKRKFLII